MYKRFISSIFTGGTATAIKLGCSLVTNKIIAIFTGVEGVGIYATLQSIFQLLLAFSQGGINTGISREVASAKCDNEYKVVKNSIYLSSFFTIMTIVLLYIFRLNIENLLRIDLKFSFFLNLAPIYLIPTVILLIIGSYYVGKSDNSRWLRLSVLQAAITAFVIIILTSKYNLIGALLGFVLAPPLALVCLCILSSDTRLLFVNCWNEKVDTKLIKLLLSFGFIALVAGICAPLYQSVVRTSLTNLGGFQYVSYWFVLNNFSLLFSTLISSIVMLFFLPKANNSSRKEFISLLIVCGVFIFSLVSCAFVLIAMFGSYIINLLYSHEFVGVLPFLKWYLVGEFFRLLIWLLSTACLVRYSRTFVVSMEVVVTGIMIISSIYLVQLYSLNGALYIYVLGQILGFFAYTGFVSWQIVKEK